MSYYIRGKVNGRKIESGPYGTVEAAKRATARLHSEGYTNLTLKHYKDTSNVRAIRAEQSETIRRNG